MKKFIYLLAVAMFVLLFACKSNQESTDQTAADSTAALIKTGVLEVKAPWVRVSGLGMNTALFFNVENGTEANDTLLSVESEAAELVEVHETYTQEDGMKGMRQVQTVEIPAGVAVSFKPQDLHVMMIKLKADVNVNDTVKAALNFAKAGKVEVLAIAQEMPVEQPADSTKKAE